MMCPFMACPRCEYQGDATPTQQGQKPGLTCENRVEVKRSPGAVLGRSGSTGDLTEIGARLMENSTRKRTSVYRYYDGHGVLLYVGVTSRATRRQGEHNDDKIWWQYVKRQEVEHYPSREQALNRERALINKHHPPFNKQHNPWWSEVQDAYFDLIARQAMSVPSLLIATNAGGRNKFPLEALEASSASVVLRSLPDNRFYVNALDIEDLDSAVIGSGGRKARIVVAGITAEGDLRLRIAGNRMTRCRAGELMVRHHGHKRITIKRVDLAFGGSA